MHGKMINDIIKQIIGDGYLRDFRTPCPPSSLFKFKPNKNLEPSYLGVDTPKAYSSQTTCGISYFIFPFVFSNFCDVFEMAIIHKKV